MLSDAGGEEQLARGLENLLRGSSVSNVMVCGAAAESALRLGKLGEAQAYVEQVTMWQEHFAPGPWGKLAGLLRAGLLLAASGDLPLAERLLLDSIEGWKR